MTKNRYSELLSSKQSENTDREMRYLDRWLENDQLAKQKYLSEDFLKHYS